MTLAKRIIPCLDVKDGRTVKGVQFENICDMGDPVELGSYYARENADELVFLDITATVEKRKTFTALVARIAAHINIPFTVGGGISKIEDAYRLLGAGADKISVNTAAFRSPRLVKDMAKQFGSQCVVVAIDTKYERGDWYVYLNGGRVVTDITVSNWVHRAADAGAGEILLTAIDNDGTRNGFAVALTKMVSSQLQIPVIASGGAGTGQHFVDVFKHGTADAALAAGIFHSKEINISALKMLLKNNDINIRL